MESHCDGEEASLPLDASITVCYEDDSRAVKLSSSTSPPITTDARLVEMSYQPERLQSHGSPYRLVLMHERQDTKSIVWRMTCFHKS